MFTFVGLKNGSYLNNGYISVIMVFWELRCFRLDLFMRDLVIFLV